MESQGQSHGKNHDKVDRPQHQSHARSLLEAQSIEFGEDQDRYDLHSAAHTGNLQDAPEANEAEDNHHVGEAERRGDGKRVKYAVEAAGDDDPLDNRVANQQEGEARGSGALHSFSKGRKKGLDLAERRAGKERKGLQ